MSTGLLDALTAARFDALLTAAADGAPLMLRARRAGTVERLTGQAQTGPLMLEPIEVRPGPGRPADLLLAAGNALGAAADDLAQWVSAPALHYKLLVARAEPADAGAWSTVAGVVAALRGADAAAGPALAVVSAGALPCPAGCQAFDDAQLFGPAEAAMLARLYRPDAGLVAEAADAAAIEVAGGNPALLECLLALGELDRFDPRAWLERQPSPDDAAPLPWRGVELPCALWQARADPLALRRRVWRGHLAVLLPWLEERRADFLARAAGTLPAGQRDRLTGEAVRPQDYEWGHIVAALRTVRDTAAADAAETLRRVRNALAHGDPAPLADCRRLEPAGRKLLAWR